MYISTPISESLSVIVCLLHAGVHQLAFYSALKLGTILLWLLHVCLCLEFVYVFQQLNWPLYSIMYNFMIVSVSKQMPFIISYLLCALFIFQIADVCTAIVCLFFSFFFFSHGWKGWVEDAWSLESYGCRFSLKCFRRQVSVDRTINFTHQWIHRLYVFREKALIMLPDDAQGRHSKTALKPREGQLNKKRNGWRSAGTLVWTPAEEGIYSDKMDKREGMLDEWWETCTRQRENKSTE